MNKVKQVILLAGGRGTRMRELTESFLNQWYLLGRNRITSFNRHLFTFWRFRIYSLFWVYDRKDRKYFKTFKM